MRHSKTLNVIAIVVLTTFTLATSYSLYCLYRSLTGVGVRGRSDVQTAALLTSIRERLKMVKNQKEAEIILKALDGIPSSVLSPNRVTEIKRAYGLSGAEGSAGNKDYTFDANDLTRAREEVLAQLFSFYRFQVVKRNLAIASLISGLIVEGNSVLMRDQSGEVYLSFVRKVKEQLESARTMSVSLPEADQSLERIRLVDVSLNALANAKKQHANWEKTKDETFKGAERAISETIGEMTGRLDKNIDSLQRDFLVAVFLFLSALVGSILVLYIGNSRIARWFSVRTDVLSKYLHNFGRNDELESFRVDTTLLEQEGEWAKLFDEVRKAEQGFRARVAAEIALSKCFGGPFVVFSPARKAIYWNSQATRLLNINNRTEVDELAIQDIFARAGMSRKKEGLSEFLKQFETGKEAFLQLEQRLNGSLTPIEVSIFPLLTGALKGGFVVVFREMREEEKRVAERLLANFQVIDQLVDGILSGSTGAIDLAPVPEQVIPLVEKLKSLKVKLDEREALWSAEIQAVWEQVKREEEYLVRFGDEIRKVETQQKSLSELSQGFDRCGIELQKTVDELERRVLTSTQVWARLSGDLDSKSQLAKRAIGYESKVREVAKSMTEWNQEFRHGLASIRKCKDWIRLNAVNLNVGGAADADVFRDRARKFSIAMTEFYDKLEGVEAEFQGFIDRHPGSSVVPILEDGADLSTLARDIQDGFVGMRADVEAWQKFSKELKALFAKSNQLSRDLDDRQREFGLLRENFVKVNESAIKELEQWN